MPAGASKGKPAPSKPGAKGGKSVSKGTPKPKSVSQKETAVSSSPAAAAKVAPVEVTKVNMKKIGNVVIADSEKKINKTKKKGVLLIDNEINNGQTIMRYGNNCGFVDDLPMRPGIVMQGIVHSIKNNQPCFIHVADEKAFDQLKKNCGIKLDYCMDPTTLDQKKLETLLEDVEHDMKPEFFSVEDCDKFYLGVLADKHDYSDEFKAQFPCCFEVEEQD